VLEPGNGVNEDELGVIINDPCSRGQTQLLFCYLGLLHLPMAVNADLSKPRASKPRG